MVATRKDSQLNIRSESSVSNIDDNASEKGRSGKKAKNEPSLSNTLKKIISKKALFLNNGANNNTEEKKSTDESIIEEEDDEEELSMRDNHFLEGVTGKLEEWLASFGMGLNISRMI